MGVDLLRWWMIGKAEVRGVMRTGRCYAEYAIISPAGQYPPIALGLV